MRDIGDARLDLEESGDDPAAAPPPRRSRTGLAVAAALAVAIVAGVAIFASSGGFGGRTAEQAEFRFELSTPATAAPEQFALSPDGTRVVSVGTSADGSSKLWLKEIGSSAERELAGTEGAEWPFWSVDGGSVSFYSQGAIKKYDLTTQGVQVLVERIQVQPFLGGTWNAAGVLLYSYAFTGPIALTRFGPQGPIEARALTKLDPRETGHAFPHFLPDGEHFLYYVNGDAQISGTYLGSLDGSVKKRLMPSDSTAVYSEPGRLLFLRGKSLYAQPFDLESLALRGDAFVVADGPIVSALGSGGMSASREGTIVYRTGLQGGSRRFVWRDEQGRELDGSEILLGAPSSPELTANGNGIVFQRALTGVNLDLWLLEIGGEAPSRITLEAGNEWLPIVSPIDDTLVYANFVLNAPDRTPTQLLTKPLSTNALRGEPLLETRNHKRPMAYSADGRTILYATLWEPSYQALGIAQRPGWDIWALSLESRQTFPVAYTEANEWNAQFSPDQSWVAFESDESGIVEVYLQSYPDGKVKKKVSPRGGAQPRWFDDVSGQYLYFVDLGGMLHRTRLIPGTEAALVSFGPVQRLFQTNIGNPAPRTYISKPQYLVDRSGRILTNDVLQSYEPLRAARHWTGQPTSK